MKIIRLVEKAPVIDSDGKWNVFCQVLRGSSYVYGVITCDTMEEAFKIKEGQIVDTDRVNFDNRTKNV